MIRLIEILKNTKFESLPDDHKYNILLLLQKINEIRHRWGKPMTVTSGYRSKEDHLRIYRQKGITDQSKIPMGSQHLKGAALDIFDPKLELTAWLKSNPQIGEELDLYFEDGNANWVHAQIFPFRSYRPGGTRWFKP